MSKKYSTSTTLVIVESPAKCKKIEEYLGPGYKCIASFGHLRELTSLKNIDIDNNFNPTYTNIETALKKKQIDLLKKEAKVCDQVILACDDDREGEAICWHISQLLKLDIQKVKRIIFNEITESALQKAIRNPTTINMDIVNAQQARQILDLLVGFKVSPMLWKHISKNPDNALSAGRCQTPALKIIYDNQKEIDIVEEKKVYNTIGYFTSQNIPFELNKQFESEDIMTDFLNEETEWNHIYTCSQPVKVFKKQPEPFTTSRLQQAASNELHISPKEAMKICQTLYEGGYITYMRTDSKFYSKEFIQSTKDYIVKTYNNERYIHENIECLILGNGSEEGEIKEKKVKVKKVLKVLKVKKPEENTNDKDKDDENDKEKIKKPAPQEAHEAIRPTNILCKELPEDCHSREKRMYKLIWENTLESCMSQGSFLSVTAKITGAMDTKYSYTSELPDFYGWKIVKNKVAKENKEYQYLQTLKQNERIIYKKIGAKVTIKNSKMHYTEAKLVQLLEENGIGRPSTFSSLVDKIQERNYVKKTDIKGKEIDCIDYELENNEIFEIISKREFGNEKSKLVIQPLGIIVIEFLERYFKDLFNYEYTKEMENDLDKISKGEKIWYDLCRDCNSQVNYLLTELGEEINDKKGLLTNDKKTTTNVLGKYEGKDVILKKGKFGLYVTWGENSKTLKELGNRPIESITFEEIEKYLEEGSNIVREISDNITIRKGKKGDYIFFKTSKMKKPQFFSLSGFVEDYKLCEIGDLKDWIKETHNVY